MEIKRDFYLHKLINRKHNGLIKVITGIRRCGKSYLLNTLFFDHLRAEAEAAGHGSACPEQNGSDGAGTERADEAVQSLALGQGRDGGDRPGRGGCDLHGGSAGE